MNGFHIWQADCLLSICDALEITSEQLLTGKGIDPKYKDADMDYEVTRSDIKILTSLLRNARMEVTIRIFIIMATNTEI
jgi:hypothetical protein